MRRNAEKKIILKVEGMTCNNCAAGIKKHLEKSLDSEVNVNFSIGEVSCYTNEKYNKRDLISLIEDIGFRVVKTKSKKNLNFSKSEIYFLVSLIFTTPLFCHMFVSETNILHQPIIQLFLCLPVYFIGIVFFGKSAYYSIKSKVPNMDVLIFIGSTAAFFYSLYGWWLFQDTELVKNYLFFETTATIITLVLLGNVLEHRSVKQTTTSIEELNKIKESIAKKELGEEVIDVNYNDIKKDDILIVNKGDQIPVDGKIIWGSCSVDESMITGESLPISKNKNDEVISGTILVHGSIKILAIKVGKETTISNIIEMVKNAQSNQPNIQKIGDKVSAIFVPFVLLISLSTFIICLFYLNISTNDSFLRAIAVLVISCPCAMGLATPTAVMVGLGRAANQGILIKGGDTLEKMAVIKNIAFDKTGTITTGRFKITLFKCNVENEDFIKKIIYNLEKHSSHPIAISLVKELEKYSSEIELKNIQENEGLGISCNYNEDKYMISSNLESSELFDIKVTKNNLVVAEIKLEDEIKTNTKEIITKLNNEGYSTYLISGDSYNKCEIINKKLKFTDFFYEQKPENKLKKIEELNNVKPTAMLGDGINDAPALSKAFIGISLSNASQIAIQSSDVILLNKNNLNQLNKAFKISRHTLRTIKQNLFWAFSYNIIAIPIACLGYLNPMWAALFMAFSDIVVIGNSIRLKFKKIF
jgi:Cu+-exporting ATPase